MAPTMANGKICYIEMLATDIARSAEQGGLWLGYPETRGWQHGF
jgi:hypothetical protein